MKKIDLHIHGDTWFDPRKNGCHGETNTEVLAGKLVSNALDTCGLTFHHALPEHYVELVDELRAKTDALGRSVDIRASVELAVKLDKRIHHVSVISRKNVQVFPDIPEGSEISLGDLYDLRSSSRDQLLFGLNHPTWKDHSSRDTDQTVGEIAEHANLFDFVEVINGSHVANRRTKKTQRSIFHSMKLVQRLFSEGIRMTLTGSSDAHRARFSASAYTLCTADDVDEAIIEKNGHIIATGSEETRQNIRNAISRDMQNGIANNVYVGTSAPRRWLRRRRRT